MSAEARREENIFVIRLNRSDKRNAFDAEIIEAGETTANLLLSQDTTEDIQALPERREPRWSYRETRTTGTSLHH